MWTALTIQADYMYSTQRQHWAAAHILIVMNEALSRWRSSCSSCKLSADNYGPGEWWLQAAPRPGRLVKLVEIMYSAGRAGLTRRRWVGKPSWVQGLS